MDSLQKAIDDLKLTDLFEIQKLQEIQDAFSSASKMAALITDAQGNPVTSPSGFSDFCAKYCQNCEEGKKRCSKCGRDGSLNALAVGKPVSYKCHAGLTDFAVPIIVKGKLLGSFVGGQVLTDEPDFYELEALADELGISDKSGFTDCVKSNPKVSREDVDRAAHFMHCTLGGMAELAFNSYVTKVHSDEAERYSIMKTDFLANMSHEIRTPMNAVIGMANLALREELSDNAKNCINQIVGSGRILLTIINDILDFSKIEAGKLDIIEEEYELMSFLSEVSNIIQNRVGDKPIELVIDVNPNIPLSLSGDINRIQQILINLAGNAVKFTSQGAVIVTLDFEPFGDEYINLIIEVKDTGIGIKSEDMELLFESFSQVDSKRNRNIEGTGLGLAITQRLVKLMNGTISVQSKYTEGSTFTVKIPQKIIDPAKSGDLTNTDVRIGLYSDSEYRIEQTKRDFSRLGLEYIDANPLGVPSRLVSLNLDYLFIEQPLFDEKMQEFADNYPGLKFVVMADQGFVSPYQQENVRVVRKPLYSLGLGLFLKNDMAFIEKGSDKKKDETSFTAPTAKVLVVDDNEINLNVTTGLLAPLAMEVDTAISGYKCLDMVQIKDYDIILMDHMMPEMDGIEATKLIRERFPHYKNIPIIAFTANVVSETRKLFYDAGMNDFIAKPIETKVLESKIRKWLPQEKMVYGDVIKVSDENGEQRIEIEGLDTEYAINLLGNEKLFWEILRDYYDALSDKLKLIGAKLKEMDINTYIIEVHSLKSTSRQVGALSLADFALEMEMAGKEGRVDELKQKTPELMELGYEYVERLSKYFVEDTTNKSEQVPIDEGKLRDFFGTMEASLEELDITGVENVIKKLSKYEFDDDQENMYLALKAACNNMDVELCALVIKEWEMLLE